MIEIIRSTKLPFTTAPATLYEPVGNWLYFVLGKRKMLIVIPNSKLTTKPLRSQRAQRAQRKISQIVNTKY